MKFVFYSSLKRPAQRAFDKGNGKHGRFEVNGKHITALDKGGNPTGWFLVVRGVGKAIKAVNQ